MTSTNLTSGVSNVVFLGTPAFALPTLKALYAAEGFHIAAVVTQPDRPAGRGNKLTPPPVKVLTEELGDIPLFQTVSLKKDQVLLNHLKDLKADFWVTVAFGQILNQDILDIPVIATVNAHASLLPEFRGANPIQQAILQGKKETGISTMLTELGIDTGAVLSKVTVNIETQDTLGSLSDKLAEAAAPLMISTLRGMLGGTIVARPQNHEQATHAAKCQKEEALLQWENSAEVLQRQIRAFNPVPGATVFFQGNRIRLLSSRCLMTEELNQDIPTGILPGDIVSTSDSGLVVQTGQGLLEILLLQPAGKREMLATDWAKGNLKIQSDTTQNQFFPYRFESVIPVC
jgi:methionyl-tRNA formyltransferase